MNTSRSSELFKTAQCLIPGGVNSPVRAFKNLDGSPFFVDKANGCYLTDVDGNQFIDYVGTWGPAILGHAPEVVIEAISKAALKGVSFGTPNPYEIEMAEIITSWVPSVEKVRMVNSGTEATLSCIRLARGFTQRDLIVKFEGCYHGHVDSLLVSAGSGSLTHSQPTSAGIPENVTKQTLCLPFNDPEKISETFKQFGDQIAAVILEPYPANTGLIFPQKEFLTFLRDITEEHGSLLIFDEVMTGFRLAKGGIQELEVIFPDLTAMGKVIGGGLPVGAFGGRADIMNLLAPNGPVYQAGTLSGNPLAMAAGIAQLKELERQDAYQKLKVLGKQLRTGIEAILKQHSLPFTCNQIGSMFCLFFVRPPIIDVNSIKHSDFDLFKKFFWNLLDLGVYIAPSLYETGFISLAHDKAIIDSTLDRIDQALGRSL